MSVSLQKSISIEQSGRRQSRMWIYQQNHTFTDQAAESVRQLPVPAVQGNCCSPEPGREPESQIRTVSLKKRRGPMAEKDLWLLAVAVLSGTAAAGVIRAMCSGFQLEWLNAYLNIWLNWHAHRSAFCCGIFYIGNRGNGFTLVRLFCIWSSADLTFPDALWHRRRPADASSPERDKL